MKKASLVAFAVLTALATLSAFSPAPPAGHATVSPVAWVFTPRPYPTCGPPVNRHGKLGGTTHIYCPV